MTVFVDTSAIYAFLDRNDEGHQMVRQAVDRLVGADLVTHGYVVAETLSLVRRRLGPEATARCIDEFLPALRVSEIDELMRHQALVAFRAGVDTDVSFVDRVSFELMRALGVETAFTLGGDFATAGFTVVP